MRHYPTAKELPNRKQRKALRGVIFAENKANAVTRRKARRELRKTAEQ